MAWKERAPQGDLIQWDEAKAIVGLYRGAEERTTDVGTNLLHTIDVDGKTFNFFGTTLLNQALAGVPDGTMVKIEHTGQTLRTKRGFRMKEFHVFTDDGA